MQDGLISLKKQRGEMMIEDVIRDIRCTWQINKAHAVWKSLLSPVMLAAFYGLILLAFCYELSSDISVGVDIK